MGISRSPCPTHTAVDGEVQAGALAAFAYDLTAEAWRGDIDGRRPKLAHKKALILQTTMFDKRAYDAGLREAMRVVIDEFTLRYPGIRNVEREYFYAVHGADDASRRGYLDRAYALGRQF